MDFTNEMNLLIQAYLKDAKKQEIALDEIYLRPHYKRVWTWWQALAYFKMDNNYERMEDVPDGLEKFNIISGNVRTQYFTLHGHNYVQHMTKEECKSIYGS